MQLDAVVGGASPGVWRVEQRQPLERDGAPDVVPDVSLAPCPAGEAVVTEAFDLASVRWVIHAVVGAARWPSPRSPPAGTATRSLRRLRCRCRRWMGRLLSRGRARCILF